tara:strand:+ start:725 stop:1579 length:855 start_codon:yes stop_codon:yes gene_type:complete
VAIGAGAIFKAAGSILGGIGQAKAIKAENARRIREYERALEIRKRNWFQQLSVYGAKVNKYNIDLNENDLAAQRGYAKAQSNLRALGGRVVAQNEAAFKKLVSTKLGRGRASGQTGRSIARRERLDYAEYLQGTGRRAYGLTMAGEKFKENVENIRRRQVSARRGLFSQVAFNPVPSMAPNPPQLRGTGMTMMNAFVGAAGALADGGMFDKGPGAPTDGLIGDYSGIGGDIGIKEGMFDFQPGGIDYSSFDSSFGGVGSFTNFDMPVNSFPDFNSGSINYSAFY